MNTPIPTFTAEALVALAIGCETMPPPLLLMQLGFNPQSENAPSSFVDIVATGSRTLAVLHDAIDPQDDLKMRLAENVQAMSGAPVFVSLRKVNPFESRVLYCGETTVVDVIDEAGNHSPREIGDTKVELENFLGRYSNHDSLTVHIPAERLERDAELLDDEEPIVSELLSDHCAWHVASIGCPADAKLNILQWRSTKTGLFEFESNEDHVSFVSTSTAQAVDSIISALDEIRNGIEL